MTVSKKVVKELKTVIVKFDKFTEWDFIPPGSFYVRIASGDYLFIKTSDRSAAQKYLNDEFGIAKYTAIPTKIQKSKSKQTNGGYSCTGTATRQVKR